MQKVLQECNNQIHNIKTYKSIRHQLNQNFKANSKEPKYKLVGECKGNDGNGCFMESCGHNCGCFEKVLIDYSENKNIEVKYTEDEVRRIAYNAYNYGQLDDPSEGKFNKFFSESKKTL